MRTAELVAVIGTGFGVVGGVLGNFGAASAGVASNVGTFFGGVTGVVTVIALAVFNKQLQNAHDGFEKTKIILGCVILSHIVSGIITNLVGGSISAMSASTILVSGIFSLMTSIAFIAAIIAGVAIACLVLAR